MSVTQWNVFFLLQWRRYDQSYGSTPAQQPDRFLDSDPPPLGFDMIVKEDYKNPNPTDFDFSKLPSSSSGPGPSYPGSGHSYGPGPYGQPPASQNYPVSMPEPYGGSSGYQAGGQYGSQPNVGFPQPYQNFPHPAYDTGYQPGSYGQPQPGASGYSGNQYYPQYQQPPQPGYGAPYGQYPSAPSPGQGYGFQGSMAPPGQYPSQQPQYPYGQGESFERAHSNSMLSAEPVSKPAGHVIRSCDTMGLPAEQ